MSKSSDNKYSANTDTGVTARRVLEIEARAIQELVPRVGASFAKACELCLACEGRVVVTGMGKSGHIAGKLAATLASTGTPAFFVHPAEASHGDLGMITRKDVVIALSNSGETAEIITLLPLLKRLGLALITLTGKTDSTLAEAADAVIDIGVSEEACPLNLAPTASTSAALAMGDALAVALLEKRGFTSEDFAMSHPGGTLGRKLLLRIKDLMHTGDKVPHVSASTSVIDGLMEMTSKGLGMTAVTDTTGKLLGMFTDGDLRRKLDQKIDLHASTMEQVMTKDCKTASSEMLAAEAVLLLEQNKINALLIVDTKNKLIGALNIHDLFRAGVM
ncbi:MAG: KpsF/GutQ family sugar-phosphate isomerase [Gammaproteobacteria bacterium]|nr:KpsF/GutQ family sugar-phosphate isomerase [Gammaproteobacteria bacterium]MCP4088583.1 KpsF/GutQ family sugar-phosphate isomerase [Gammaproteobacteria bacterium]MCP4276509.1 KpsF/GutQ family sugar-phosphate isomerase [Gammaproteobacteria bacterium]MCP4832386.1 KpsF/GutQ family sugar-phosphate isomerase [Gammaproteobacteria bacterium]MCP4929100.1 KpsF/GutQ family sugar-phosphate isomerase [Gammaproteobacteria bacterium]